MLILKKNVIWKNVNLEKMQIWKKNVNLEKMWIWKKKCEFWMKCEIEFVNVARNVLKWVFLARTKMAFLVLLNLCRSRSERQAAHSLQSLAQLTLLMLTLALAKKKRFTRIISVNDLHGKNFGHPKRHHSKKKMMDVKWGHNFLLLFLPNLARSYFSYFQGWLHFGKGLKSVVYLNKQEMHLLFNFSAKRIL